MTAEQVRSLWMQERDTPQWIRGIWLAGIFVWGPRAPADVYADWCHEQIRAMALGERDNGNT